MENDSFVKIISTLGVNIAPIMESTKIVEAEFARLSAIAKATQLVLPGATGGVQSASQVLAPMTAQQAMIQGILKEGETRKATIVSEGEAKINAINEKSAMQRQALEQKTDASILMQREKTNAQIALLEQKSIAAQTRTAAYSENTGGFGNLISRHLGWLAAGSVIMGSFELIKTGISDISASMTKLQQVLEIVPPYASSPAKLAKDLGELKDVAGVMATAYGVEFSKVLDVMAQAGRRFKDVASIISATDTALQLVVVDAVPVETAIKSVEAIMSQFGLTTGESKQALFEISAAAHMLQINATDLLQAIQRSGSAFSTMKMNTKESVAAISTLAQMTAQGGGTIGNTWKSLEASLASDKGQKALKELGVELFDANGNIKNMSTTLVDLQEKWGTLSDRAKMHYATVLAGGKFQYQKLQAFLDDYTGAYKKALAGIETANADMQKKLVEAAMTSLPQQLRMTSASLQVLTSELTADATPALIMFLTSVRGGIVDLKDHKEELKNILDTGAKLAEGYIAWKIGVYAFGVATKIAASEVIMFNSAAGELYMLSLGMPPVLAGVAGGIVGIGAAAIGALAKLLPLIAGMMALNRLYDQKTDPIGTKIGDLQAEQDRLQSLIKDQWTPGESLQKAGADAWKHPGQAFNHVLDAGLGWLPTADSSREKAQSQWNANEGVLNSLLDQKKAATEDALNRDLNNLNEIMAKYEAEANEKTAAALAGAGLDADSPITDYTGGDSNEKSKAIKEYLESLGNAAKAFEISNYDMESSLSAVGRSLSLTGSEYDYLKTKMESGAYTAQDYARMQELVGIKSTLVKDEQVKLTAANEQYKQEITALTPVLAQATAEYEQFKTAGDFDHMKDAQSAVSSLQGEIDNLTNSIAENTQKVWDNKGVLDELTTKTYVEYFQSAMDWMGYMESIGQMSTEQQLEYLKSFDKTNLALKDQRTLQKEIYDANKTALEEEMTAIKTAYDEKKQMYEDEITANEDLITQKEANIETYKADVDAQIVAIQKLMDILDSQGTSEDKTEAERQHNQTIADLIKERQYNEIRTGLEHQTAIVDIDRQIAEENISWQLKQNDDARDAQKEAYQSQIDALEKEKDAYGTTGQKEIDQLKKTNDKKKSELEKYYKQVEGLLNDNTLNMLATIGGYDDQFYQKALNNMKAFEQGIKDGKTNISADAKDFFTNDVTTEYNKAKSSSGSSGTNSAPTVPTKTTTTSANKTAPADWFTGETAYLNSLKQTGDAGQKAWANQLLYLVGLAKSGDAGQKIWARSQASDMGVTIPQAHTGAFVNKGGLAELLKGERVLDPQLTVSFDRLAMAMAGNPSRVQNITNNNHGGDFDKAADKIISAIEKKFGVHINGPVVSIEQAGFEDKADMQVLGLEISSVIRQMVNKK